jgi:putative ABC transport system permease protein
VRAGPIASTAAGALARRRVQTVMMGVVLLISTFASVLAVALIVDSNSPFDKAFAAQHGAQLTVAVNASRVTPAQMAATTRLPEVTAAAGPYPEAAITATVRAQGGGLIATQDSLILVGRNSPGGALDDLKLTAGHWPASESQIVLSAVNPGGNAAGGGNAVSASGPIGETIAVTSAPGAPQLTVVGLADSVTQSADGWVLPGEIGKLTSPGAPAGAQMFYRFANGASASALTAEGAALRRALPRGAVVATEPYLVVQSQESERISLFVPFVVAFGVIGLVLSVLIVANVISGAVVSDYTRIGILKSIGFTPGQVVATYVAQAMVPGAAGVVIGAGLGDLLAERLILRRTASAYSVGVLGVPAWIVVGIPLALWLLSGLVALAPALRGGRLGAIEAIAAGRAPRTDHGYAAHRLASRLALPRPLTLGITAPFARPARTAMTLIAVVLGATAVTFAYGLTTSLDQVANALRLENTVQVNVYPPVSPDGFTNGFTAGQQQAVAQAADTLAGTQHVIAETDVQVKLTGMTTPVAVTAYSGDVGWMQYQMVSGHWYTRPGQAVVPLGFLKLTGAAIGDTVSINLNGRTIPVKIVGQVFADENRGMYMVTDASTLTGAGGGLLPTVYDIGLRQGTSPSAYAQALSNALPLSYSVNLNNGSSSVIIAMTSLIAFLTVMLAIAAGLGVLNTVVVQTRERAHDLGIFKAVGMTPRQTIALVVSWTAGIGLVAGIIGVPVGLSLHRYVLPAMAAAANLGTPARFIDVYGIPAVVVLGLAGLIIAVAGALAPASWAAGSRTATALRAE